MISQKGTINIILLIIIVALAAALVYLVAVPKSERNGAPAPGQNSPPSPLFLKEGKGEFEGWKTYRNEAYGFEVDYPVEYKFNEYKSPSSHDLQVRFETQRSDPHSYEGFELWVTGNLENNLDNYYFGNGDSSLAGSGKLGDLVANVYESSRGFYCPYGDCGEPAVAFVTERAGAMYHIIFFGSSGQSELLDSYKKILSTFKFME